MVETVSVGQFEAPPCGSCARKDHESGQVVIERTQTVNRPGTDRGVPAEAVPVLA